MFFWRAKHIVLDHIVQSKKPDAKDYKKKELSKIEAVKATAKEQVQKEKD
jgi:hypothetical protein